MAKSVKKVHTKKKVVAKLSTLKKKAWSLLSECIRREAADRNGYVRCYTCGTSNLWNRGTDAGHAIPGRHGSVLLDESIIRPQCKVCNIWKRGNYPVFTLKLINEHSAEWFERKLADAHKIVKWTSHDLTEKIKEYDKRLEQLGKK